MERTLHEEIELYLADCRRRGLRSKTLATYRQALLDFSRSLPGVDPPLASLTLAAGRAWQDERTGAVSTQTLHSRTRVLRTFAAWAAGEEDLPADPLVRLRGPRLDRRLRTVPTDDELARVVELLDPERQVVVLVLAGTGMRVGDLCRLELDDLQGETLLLRDTKTREDRALPLDAALQAMLGFYTRELRPVPKTPFERHLFLTRRGQPYRPEVVAGLLRATCRRAGLGPRRFTPHALRHWFARDLIAHGTNPMLVAARGGWKTLAMLVHYAQVNELTMRADVERYAPAARIAGAPWRGAGVARYAASPRSASSGRTRR